MRNLKEILKEMMDDRVSMPTFELDDNANINGTSKKTVLYTSLSQLFNLFGEPNVKSSDGIEYDFSSSENEGVALFLRGDTNISPSDNEYTERLPWSVCAHHWGVAYEFVEWFKKQV